LSSQLAEVESRELAQIEAALELMRDGKYGVCEGCEKPIPLARLQALPYAATCIECQRAAERSGVGDGYVADWGRLLDSDGGDKDVTFSDIEVQ